MPQAFWMWAPLHFGDRFTHLALHEHRDGSRWLETALVLDPLPGGGGLTDTASVREARDIRYELDWEPGRREIRSAVLSFTDPVEGDVRIELEKLFTFRMRGIGYGHPYWAHGTNHGTLETGRESIRLEDFDPLDIPLDPPAERRPGAHGRPDRHRRARAGHPRPARPERPERLPRRLLGLNVSLATISVRLGVVLRRASDVSRWPLRQGCDGRSFRCDEHAREERDGVVSRSSFDMDQEVELLGEVVEERLGPVEVVRAAEPRWPAARGTETERGDGVGPGGEVELDRHRRSQEPEPYLTAERPAGRGWP